MMDSIIGIQILGVLFSLFMIYVSFIYNRRKEFTSKEYFAWLVLWIGFLMLSLFPTSLDFFISDIIGFSRRLDFFIVAGFMILTGIVFYIYILVRKNQNKLEKLVRKIAIENEK